MTDNIVDITVRVTDKATAGLAAIEESAKASGSAAGGNFASEFDRATTGGGGGLLSAMFGGDAGSVVSDAERAGQQAGQGLGRGMEQKFSSSLGSGLLSGLLGTSGGTKLFSSAGNTVVQDAAAQGEKIAQGLAQGLDEGFGSASSELGSLGTLLAGISDEEITPSIDLQGFSEAESEIASLESDLRSFSGADASIGLSGTAEDVAELKTLGAELDEVGDKHVSPSVSLSGGAETIAEAETVKAGLDSVAASSKSAGGEASGLGESLGFLAEPMGALIAAGIVLSPVILAVGVGIGGFAAAAYSAAKPIIAASEATGGLKANLDSLDPAQQQVAKGLLGLESEFGQFSQSMQPEVFSAFNSGLSIAKTLLGDMEPVAKAAGGALDTVLQNVAKDFQSGEWQQFFQFLAQNAAPDVQLLGSLFINLANDLPPLLEQLQPGAEGLLRMASGAAVLAGDLDALDPALTQGSVSAARMHQSNGSLLGDFVSMIDKAKEATSQVTGLGQSTSSAATSISSAGGSAQKAAPQVGTLAGDVAILGTASSTAAQQTSALTDEWSIFVGKAVGDQQAVLSVATAFDSFNSAVKTSGADSDAAQTAFLGIISAMGSGLSTLQSSGATLNQINGFYQVNIEKLTALHGLNATQEQDIQGVVKSYDAWANSTSGLTTKTIAATAELKNDFLAQIGGIAAKAPAVTQDITNITDSILKTGTESSATKAARDQLISDLENAGVSAQKATSLVNNLTTALGKVPRSVSTSVAVKASAQGTLDAIAHLPGSAGSTQDSLLFTSNAAGGYISGPGGPTSDDILSWLSDGEYVVKAAAVSKYGTGMLDAINGMHYADGGSVNLGGPQAFMASNEATWATAAVKDFMSSSIGAFQSQLKAAEASELSATLLHPSGSGVSVQSLMQSMAASVGWTGAEWTALNNVEMREAGYNLSATNPSSGAYGLAQFINGAGEYAQYGGSSATAPGQITGMLNYIKQRYGDPEAAWAHEVAYGWYDHGGWLQPGYTLAYNGTGAPEPVGAAALGASTVRLEISGSGGSAFDQFMLTWMRENVRLKGGGSVQKAFGYGTG